MFNVKGVAHSDKFKRNLQPHGSLNSAHHFCIFQLIVLTCNFTLSSTKQQADQVSI